MEEGTKDSYEKPDPRKSWTGDSKWISKYSIIITIIVVIIIITIITIMVILLIWLLLFLGVGCIWIKYVDGCEVLARNNKAATGRFP